jgi:hypothetical protein
MSKLCLNIASLFPFLIQWGEPCQTSANKHILYKKIKIIPKYTIVIILYHLNFNAFKIFNLYVEAKLIALTTIPSLPY